MYKKVYTTNWQCILCNLTRSIYTLTQVLG